MITEENILLYIFAIMIIYILIRYLYYYFYSRIRFVVIDSKLYYYLKNNIDNKEFIANINDIKCIHLESSSEPTIEQKWIFTFLADYPIYNKFTFHTLYILSDNKILKILSNHIFYNSTHRRLYKYTKKYKKDIKINSYNWDSFLKYFSFYKKRNILSEFI